MIVILYNGSYFGEIIILNLLNIGNRWIVNVWFEGYLELLCLFKEDLFEVLIEYLEVRKLFEICGRMFFWRL